MFLLMLFFIFVFYFIFFFFFFQAEDGIRDRNVTGVQTCALPILSNEPRLFAPAQQSSPASGPFPALAWRREILESSKERSAGSWERGVAFATSSVFNRYLQIFGVIYRGDRKSTRLNSSHVSISYA